MTAGRPPGTVKDRAAKKRKNARDKGYYEIKKTAILAKRRADYAKNKSTIAARKKTKYESEEMQLERNSPEWKKEKAKYMRKYRLSKKPPAKRGRPPKPKPRWKTPERKEYMKNYRDDPEYKKKKAEDMKKYRAEKKAGDEEGKK